MPDPTPEPRWWQWKEWIMLARYRASLLRQLLRSADASWEQDGGGHDWRDTVRRVRRHLTGDSNEP